MQAESITALEGFGSDVIPVEYFLSVDDSQRVRTQDAVTIAELGKQLLLSAKNGETEQVRDLMCRGAPFTTDWLGTSALHLAAQGNHLDTAIALLRAGISKDARTKVDRTPLHMAAYEGHNEMAVLLLKEGADVDSKDMLKMTPLHWAVENDHQEVILTLLEKGADPNVVSKFDKTPISLALEHNRLDFVELMQQEREILALRAQQQRDFQIQLHNQLQSQENSAEIEEATHSLMQIEAERQQEQQIQQFEIQQVQQKRKIAQVPAPKKPRMVFQQIHSSSLSEDEQEKQLEMANRINNITNNPYRKQKDMIGFSGLNQPYRILEAHGITMIPNESDGSIVGNAMESGGTVVLTEAGKMALNLTGANKLGLTRIQVGPRRGVGKKIITLARADQLIGQNAQTLTSRGPNILKRNASDNKPGKYFLASIGNNSTTVTAVKAASSKKSMNESPRKVVEPMLLQLDDEIEEVTDDTNSNEDGTEQVMDVALLNRKLAEARRLNADYRKQLQKKEEEAEIYKQQLRNITAQNTAK